ncbi:MAG: hypothetical protein K6F71_04705 [Ruminococcus sp.]|uniref:hypothetical protein n=1 Tax=Ruminococcus sp. TaxID=41978 RepID=UPI0025FDB91D|nr:hypothetical protein [Ruminococcus sp.]MCR5540115.1 hypothetical protein [Ruminococcus sp.]
MSNKNKNLPSIPSNEPHKIETWAGKETARVTKIFNQDDGSVVKATRKINKDGSISDKIEHRHK